MTSLELPGALDPYGIDALLNEPTAPAGAASGVDRGWAIAAGVFADLTSAYANFNQVRQETRQAKAQASALGFRSRMLELDRRAAEMQAQDILRAGQSQIGQVSLEGGQRRAALEVATAASGVDASGANAREAQASERLLEAIDVYNINLASVQQANAARRQATNIGNEARFARTASVNLRRQARAAAPEAALLGGLGRSAARTSALLTYKPS